MKPTATLGGGQTKVTVFMIIVGIIFLCIFVGLLTLIVSCITQIYPFKRCTAGKIRSEEIVWVKHSKYTEHSAK